MSRWLHPRESVLRTQPRKNCFCLGWYEKQVRCSPRTWLSFSWTPTHKAICDSTMFPTGTAQPSYNLPANKAEPRQPVYILTVSQSALEVDHHTPHSSPVRTTPAQLPGVGTTPDSCVAQQQMRWEISARGIEAASVSLCTSLILPRVSWLLVSKILLHMKLQEDRWTCLCS